MRSRSLRSSSRGDAREEPPDFPRPPSEVRAEDLLFVGVDHLGGVKVLTTPARQEVAVSGGTQVPNPLRLTSRSNQVSDTTDAEQVDWRATWDAGLATAHFEDARAPHTDTDPRGPGDDAIEDIAGEPAWSSIVRVRTHAGHARPSGSARQQREHRAGGAFVHHPHKLSAWPCGFRVRPAGEAST